MKFIGKLGLALTMAALALFNASCGGSGADSDFTSTTTAQTTIKGGLATTLTLTGNTMSVTFPSNTFKRDTVALISTEMSPAVASSDESEFLQYYPTASKQVSDVVSGLVINTPVDRVFKRDITVRFAFFETATRTPGEQYLIYRFDFDNLVWNRWGNIAATVDAGGNTASVTLPTTDYRGFIGVLALFKDLRVDNQPAYTPTTVSGTVVGESGGIATDVSLYYYVGTVQYPVSLPQSSGARIPTGGAYRNTVDSAANGSFTFNLPDYLVGQQLNIEFGREDPDHQASQEFDILAPTSPYADDRDLTEVRVLTVRYGINNVRSHRVPNGNEEEPAIVLEPLDM